MVSWEYPPVMYGGLGRHVEALSRALARDGHDVTVLSQAPAGTPETSLTDVGGGAPVRCVRAVRDRDAPDVYGETGAFVRSLQAALLDAMALLPEDWRPDVVHGHDWVVAEATTSLAEMFDVPLVMTVHATETGLHHGHLATDFSRWRHGVERSLVQQADRVIVCSSDMHREVVSALDAQPDTVTIVPNGVDTSAWATTAEQRETARATLGVGAAPFVVLVGRLEHEKGAQDAIEALVHLRHPAHLVLVGEGARRHDLRELADRRGVAARVHLTGRLDDVAVAATVAAADVALVPSRYEPFGLVALEAMAAGTPVVASTAGGLRDVVTDGVTGRTVAPGDPRDLARVLDAVLGDPDSQARLSRLAARAVRERFSWPAVASATAAVYADVLD